jgi:ribonuclease Z
MLKTFALRGREVPLTVYGPGGLQSLMSDLRRVYGKLTYDVHLQELDPSDAVSFDGFCVGAYGVVHRLEALGYALFEDERPGRFDPDAAERLGVRPGPEFGRLQSGEEVGGRDGTVRPQDVMGEPRPGRRIVISGDSAPCKQVAAASRGADLLVHDGSFATEEADRATETGHSTARDAALLARDAGVKLLALVHASSRYNVTDLLAEAREVVPGAVAPRDFDLVEVPFPERGEPKLVRKGALERGPHRTGESEARADSDE